MMFMVIVIVAFLSVVNHTHDLPVGPLRITHDREQFDSEKTAAEMNYLYGINSESSYGIGTLSAEGWWSFNEVDFFDSGVECEFCNLAQKLDIIIKSSTSPAEFRLKESAIAF